MVALSHLLVEGIVWTVDLLQGENLGLTLLVKPDDDGVSALFPPLRHCFLEKLYTSRDVSKTDGVAAAARIWLLWRGLFFLSFSLLSFSFGCVYLGCAEAGCGLYKLYLLDVFF